MNDNEEKIYDLIITKSFDELSNDEKAFVMENLGSEIVYARMREANLAAVEAMAEDEEVPADMKASVMEAFDKKSNKKRGIIWWKYAAAVAILILGGYVFWPAGNPEKVQLAENVEREKPTTTDDTQNESEEKESAPITDSEGETETSDSREPKVGSEAEQITTEDKRIVEEISDKVEIADDEEMTAEVAELQLAKDVEPDDSPIIEEEEFEEQDFGQAKSLADDAASPESPSVVQTFSADRARQQNVVTMSESVSSKRKMDQNQIRSDGISLSQIGGPFPKGYVAY